MPKNSPQTRLNTLKIIFRTSGSIRRSSRGNHKMSEPQEKPPTDSLHAL